MIQRYNQVKKQGVIAPLFAFLLPVLLIFSAFAVNLAYMQLTTTQLKIASDAASHAGGRALSEFQNTDRAIEEMDKFARLNPVARHEIVIPQNDEHMQFGQAVLRDGKYEFIQHSKAVADAGEEIINSVRVFAEVDTPMAFRFQNADRSFNPTRNSITHQRDRDIAMVLDRSGSMLEFTNIPILDAVLQNRLDNEQISQAEFNLAKGAHSNNPRVYTQYFTNNTLNEMAQLADILEANDHELAREVRKAADYAESLQRNLKSPTVEVDLTVSEFATDAELQTGQQWYSRYQNGMVEAAPEDSRWSAVVEAMNEFFTVLEQTDQEEQVALVVFSSSTQAESILTSDYDLLRSIVAGIVPIGGTQIGEGLRRGLQEVVNYEDSGRPANSRPFAEKMIVVMTDGVGTGLSPVSVAETFKAQNPEAVIHAVTFGEGADQTEMVGVATAGGGNHYHANDASMLAEEFREIANIPPTIFTY